MSADFLFKEKTGRILGCAFEVHKIMPRLDTKMIPRITHHDYLRITGLQAALILNFKNSSLEYKRVALTQRNTSSHLQS